MKLKAFLASSAAALTFAVPAVASDLTFSWGVGLTSNYVSRGLTNSNDRPAIQPWVEIETNGFYAGLWASNVNFGPGDPDRAEIDLYGGYRFSVSGLDLDIGYARYFYDRSGNCCGEFYLLGSVETGAATLFSGIYLDHSGGWSVSDIHAGASFAFNDQFSVSGAIGGAEGGHRYGHLGVSYALNDNVELDLRAHRSRLEGSRLVAGASISF